ncbi:putative 60S ribosomal protein L32 [Blattamonas nauphoetae]|uniref:60S ribosomal protein L32 n=1 Tax=Blattamonas nauphoetae TaxID=2049346 RepID=A0ABQ9YMK6_9EUKA|nr:putative 60S ribosomal protein L32 [Blattamonas nauphoetae]
MVRKPVIVKKRTKRFLRFESDKLKTINPSWRRPRGIDNGARRKYLGAPRLVNIGYGSAKSTRHMLPNGYYKFRVFNAKELDMIMMQSHKYCAEIAHTVGAKSRVQIRERAAELGIRVINGKSGVRKPEAK